MSQTGELLPDGLTLTEYSFAATWLGLDALTSEVSNVAVYEVAQLTGALDLLTDLTS